MAISFLTTVALLSLYVVLGYYVLKWVHRITTGISSSEVTGVNNDSLFKVVDSAFKMDNKYRTFYKRLLEKENPNPTVLRQTLIKRIMTSMEFKEKIDSQKNSLYQLFKNGNMGEDVWQKYQQSSAQVDDDLAECSYEAQLLDPTWDAINEVSRLIHQKRQLLAQAQHQHASVQEQQEISEADIARSIALHILE